MQLELGEGVDYAGSGRQGQPGSIPSGKKKDMRSAKANEEALLRLGLTTCI